MLKTKAIVIDDIGGPEVLQYKEVILPELAKDEVLLKHTAIGVNYLDTYYRSGLYPIKLPFILGDEGIGIIEDKGCEVKEFNVGDRVAYPACQGGAYSLSRIVKANLLVPVPEDIPDKTVAASLLRGMTAEYLINRLHKVTAGETVLIHAVAGGTGQILCQWAKHKGATVIGTVSSEEKATLAKQNGCDFPLIYTENNFVESVNNITNGEMVDVVYDGVGRSTFTDSLKCLRSRGLMVSFGNASGKPEPLDVLELAKQGSLFLTRPTLFEYTKNREELLAGAAHYFDLLKKNIIKINKIETFSLVDAAEAHRFLVNRKKTGFPILIP